MPSTSVFPCIMAMISNFTIIFVFQISIFKFFFTNTTVLCIENDSCCSFVNNFIFFVLKLIIFIACSLKDSQYFFIQSLPLYTSCLYFMLLNDDILGIDKPDGIYLLSFVVPSCTHLIFRFRACFEFLDI